MKFDGIARPRLAGAASRLSRFIAPVLLALCLLPAGAASAAPEEDPEEPGVDKPGTSNAGAGKPGTIDPEQVDWQSLKPGEEPAPPKREIKETPWSAKLSLGAGVDSNIDLFPTGSDNTLLGGLGFYGQAILSRNLRIGALGVFEKNIGKDTPGASEAEFFTGYMRELPHQLQLRVSNIAAYARERSVFADGTVLLSATTLQTIFKDNAAAIVARRQGAFDIEVGTQFNFEGHSGKIEDSRLFGADAIAALRYTFRDRLSFRLRYTYEYSNTTGLSSRNLAGGIDSQDLPLKIGVHRVRTAARARITRDSQIVARFDRVYATDDFSGFLNSHESVAFLGLVANSRWVGFEGDFQYAKRFFTDRIATIDNPNEDTVISGTARIDIWALFSRRLGLFAMYRYEKASASPTGILFERHVALSGIAGRFGSTR